MCVRLDSFLRCVVLNEEAHAVIPLCTERKRGQCPFLNVNLLYPYLLMLEKLTKTASPSKRMPFSISVLILNTKLELLFVMVVIFFFQLRRNLHVVSYYRP